MSGDFADVFDGVGAQLGEFDVVTCFGKLNSNIHSHICGRFLGRALVN